MEVENTTVRTATLRDFDSNNVEQEIYLRSEGTRLMVGTDAERARKYYALDIADPIIGKMKIGIECTYHGIDPSWIFSADGSVLAIGHDLTVSFIDAVKHRLALDGDLDGVFYEFIPEMDGICFVVLHELGVARFDFSGTRLWSVPTPDIAESAQMRDGETLVVRHQGPSKELAIDILTGRVKSSPAKD